MTVAVIIVAAGRGTRLGAELPKQYIPLGDQPAIRRSIDAFLAITAVTTIVPIIHPDDRDLCDMALADVQDVRLLPPVEGGATRALSVRQGLERLVPVGVDRVLIHDAARPFITRSVIEAVIAGLDDADGTCAALPVVDALWRAEGSVAVSPLPRDGLWRAQTPQGFHFDKILNAHRTHDGTGADDVAVAHEAGMTVRLVMGSERNYKITTADDLRRAQSDLGTAEDQGV